MRWLRGSLVGLLLACVLSVAVPVATAPPAQALVPAVPVVVGGAPMAVVGAASVLGVAGHAALAFGIYSTRDSWAPSVRRLLGLEDDGDTAGIEPATGDHINSNLHIVFAAPPSVGSEVAVITVQINGGSAAYEFGYDMACRSVASGAVQWKSGQSTRGTIGSIYGNPKTHTADCGAGFEVIYIQTRARSDGGYTSGHAWPATYAGWSYPEAEGDSGLDDAASTWRVTSRCVLAGGGTQDLTIEYSGVTEHGFQVPSCLEAGISTHADRVTVEGKLEGQTDFREVWSGTADPEPLYPDCDPATGAACELEVWLNGQPCVVGAVGCVDWAAQTVVQDVTCHWGPYEVPLSRCSWLERAYEPGGVELRQGEEANFDGDPATQTDGPGVEPSPTASTPADTGGFPNEVDVPGGTPDPTPEDLASGGQGCFPTGSAAWNPVEWVMLPVQCALVWAWVPEEGLATRAQGITDAWGNSDVGQWVTTTATVGSSIGGDLGGRGGCEGPVWNISLGERDYRFAPLDACVPPMSNIAPWVKAAISALIVIVGVKMALRSVTRALDLPQAPG